MKHLLVAFALLISLPVLAEKSISIKPGSSVDIDGVLVKCTGTSSENSRKCSVRNYTGSIYEVLVEGSVWGKVDGFDNAVKLVIELKNSGLCI